MRKESIIALLVLVSLAIPGTMFAMGDVEPNNTFETAESLAGGNYTGSVSTNDTVDYYVIDIPQHKEVNIIVTSGYGSSINATLYDKNRTLVDFGNAEDGGATTLLYDPGGSSDRVYLKIEGSGQLNNYTLNVQFPDSALEKFKKSLTSAAVTVSLMCIGAIVVILVILVVIVYLIVRKKRTSPPMNEMQNPPKT